MITYLLHKNYRFSSAFKYWIHRKFTPAGALVIGGILLTGGIGVDTNQAVAYQAFALLWCLLLVSLAWSLWPAPRLKGDRLLPRLGTVGQPLPYRVTVFNPGTRIQAGVMVAEDLGDPRPTYREFVDNPEPGERRRNLFDRFFRFYRWMWLIARKQIATSAAAPLPPLAPNREVNTEMKLVPLKRGALRLEGLLFWVTDPFGLCRSYSRCEAPGTALILPKRYMLPTITLGGANHYQPGGVSLAASVGVSEEFLSLREYRRGDPLRHIHWKSTSKTGKLIVKEFQNEFYVRQALILDTYLDEPGGPVFEEAVSIAASFALALNTQESLLDLLFVGPKAYCITTGQGVAQVEHMLEVLASVQPCGRGTFADLEELVLRQIGLVSGCVCILLKWDEARKDLVEQIGARGVPLLVLVLKRPKDKTPKIEVENERIRIVMIDTERVQESLSRIE